MSMTKTNAEILENWIRDNDITSEEHIFQLMDRARAEERKKLKPKITRKQWQKMTNAILNIDIKTPFTYKESFEITNDILEAMGLEVEK